MEYKTGEEVKMKNILIGILALLMSCAAGNAFAEDLAGRFSVGIAAGGIFPEDSDIDDSCYVGGNFAYGINEHLAIGVEAGYTSWDDEEAGVDYGEVEAIPLLADLYLRFPVEVGENMFVPYVIGGAGVIFWDYEESDLLTSNAISVDMDAELGIKAGGGFDYFFTDNVAINFEGGYIWSDADMSVAAFGTHAAATIDTDYWLAIGGFKRYF